MSRLTLTLRIDVDRHRAIGRGKITLLALIREKGSISAASRTMGMSYRKTRLLVDDLNRLFKTPLIIAVKGGGACLSELGQQVLTTYQKIAQQLNVMAAPLCAHIAPMLADRSDQKTH